MTAYGDEAPVLFFVDTAAFEAWLEEHVDHQCLQKYVPRRPRSRWSQVNVRKVAELRAAGRLRPAGLAEVEAARGDGRWDAAYVSQKEATVPLDLAAALAASPAAAAAFGALGKSEGTP